MRRFAAIAYGLIEDERVTLASPNTVDADPDRTAEELVQATLAVGSSGEERNRVQPDGASSRQRGACAATAGCKRQHQCHHSGEIQIHDGTVTH